MENTAENLNHITNVDITPDNGVHISYANAANDDNYLASEMPTIGDVHANHHADHHLDPHKLIQQLSALQADGVIHHNEDKLGAAMSKAGIDLAQTAENDANIQGDHTAKLAAENLLAENQELQK